MAIQKAKTLPSGVSGDYWRITTIAIDRQNFIIKAQVGLFKDAAASAANKPHMGLVKTFEFPFTMVEFLAAPNAISFVYSKIIAKAETMITHTFDGTELPEPVAYDQDLAGGVSV